MANLLFDLPVMGRELPRGQRWNDVPGEDEARSDPGFDRISYLRWEREETDDWEDLVVELVDPAWVIADAAWEPEPEPDILVTVNGLPLEVWLALGWNSDIALWDELLEAHRHEYVLEDDAAAAVDDLVHGTNEPRHYRLALFRQIDGKNGAPCGHGHGRCNSRARYGHSVHSNLKAHEADRIRQRRMGREVQLRLAAAELNHQLALGAIRDLARMVETYWVTKGKEVN